MLKNDLYTSAVSAERFSYSPYSDFPVGAAIRTFSGSIYVGCNVENAAYPEGLCAEASAIAHMVSSGETQISEICIYSSKKAGLVPCGGCRQKISEFSTPDTLIHLSDSTGIVETLSLSDLLPHFFGGDDLV